MTGVCSACEGEFYEHLPSSESLTGVVAGDEGAVIDVGRTLGTDAGPAWTTPGPNTPESSGETTGAAIDVSTSPTTSEAPARPRPKD